MIGFIQGTVIEVSENLMVVETGGIGYEINASSFTLSEKGRIGERVKLFTYMAVREDGISLYGFYSLPEKAMFLRLISVSGIGPKVALSVLSGLSLQDLTAAIMGDVSLLQRIKGVGKKTAERISLELKDKIPLESFSADYVPIALSDNSKEAINALMSMGFTKQEASSAIARVKDDSLTVEQLIITALKNNH